MLLKEKKNNKNIAKVFHAFNQYNNLQEYQEKKAKIILSNLCISFNCTAFVIFQLLSSL
jgi:hypothetical protein